MVADYSVVGLTPPPIPGDVNHDGVVNGLDINLVAANWLDSGSGQPGDANGDGVVNGLDINMIAANWGDTTGKWRGRRARAGDTTDDVPGVEPTRRVGACAVDGALSTTLVVPSRRCERVASEWPTLILLACITILAGRTIVRRGV